MKACGFGYKNAWLAAKGVEPALLAEAIGLVQMRPSDWEPGVEAAYDWSGGEYGIHVFVTSSIGGWVLAVGIPLAKFVDDRPPTFPELAARVAQSLQTEVQYFGTHRVVEQHAWAQATPAGLVRAYAFVGDSGEKLVDLGEPTQQERELGFAFADPSGPEAQDDGYWERDDLRFPDESCVMRLADRWSIDPSELEKRDLAVEPGLLGELRAATPARLPRQQEQKRP